MLARRPAGPIEANLPHHLQGREAIDPIDLGQVHPGHRSEIGLYIKLGGLLRLERHGRTGVDGGASASMSGTNAWRHSSMCPSHARNCCARKSYWSTACCNA